VAVLWIAGIVVLVPLASGLAAVTNDTASAGLPSGAQSAQVAELQQEAQHASGRPVSQQAIVVFARPGGMTPGDLAAVTAARAAAGALDGRAGGLGSPGAVQRSADGDAALFTVAVSSPQDSVTSVDTRAVTAVRQAVAPAASRARDGLRVAVTGDAAVTADSGSTTLSALLLSTLVMRSPWLSPALAPGEPGSVPSTTAPVVEPCPPLMAEPTAPPVEESWTWIPRKPVAPMWMVELPRPVSMLLATDSAVPIGMAYA